jgi:hypothetical protein
MIAIEQEIEESCHFLRRFLAGERGFSTGDVLAGIARLRDLHGRSTSSLDRDLARVCVRRACEKLGRKDKNYQWACEV